jgi:hypothetical protein
MGQETVAMIARDRFAQLLQGPDCRGSGAVGKTGYLCFSTYRAGLLASRTGAARPLEDLFAELEDVCPQSRRPVNRRLRFPGRGDRAVPSSLCVPSDGGWHKAHCERNRRRKKRSPSAIRSLIKLSRECSQRLAFGKNRNMGCQDGTRSVRPKNIYCSQDWFLGFPSVRKPNK